MRFREQIEKQLSDYCKHLAERDKAKIAVESRLPRDSNGQIIRPDFCMEELIQKELQTQKLLYNWFKKEVERECLPLNGYKPLDKAFLEQCIESKKRNYYYLQEYAKITEAKFKR